MVTTKVDTTLALNLVKTSINNTTSSTSLLDSGAIMSVISSNFTSKHNIQTYDLSNDIVVQLADANVEVVIKEYAVLDVVLYLLHGPVKLLKLRVGVADIVLNEVIIGRPALAFLNALPEYHIPTGTFYLDKVPLMLSEDTVISKVSVKDHQVQFDVEKNMTIDLNMLPPPVDFDDPDDPVDKPEQKLSDSLRRKIESSRKYLKDHFDWTLDVGTAQKQEDLFDEMLGHVKEFLIFKEQEKCSVSNKDFMDLLLSFQDVFRTTFGGDPCARVSPMPIKLKASADLKGHARINIKLSDDAQLWLKDHLEKLIAMGILVKCRPEDGHVSFSEPVFLIPKKDKDPKKRYRFIQDVRRINANSEVFYYPLPTIEEVMSALFGAKYFSALDMLKGYNQFPVADEASRIFVINTPQGLFRFCRIPMGFVNSVAWYQFTMTEEVLKNLVRKICLVYIDDVLIYSKSADMHLEHIRASLLALRNRGVKCNIKKAEFFKTSIIWIGRQFTPDGVKPNPEMVDAIRRLDITTPQDLQRFYHCISWIRASIPDFSRKIAPLHTLLEQQYTRTYRNKRTRKALAKLKNIDGWNSSHAKLVTRLQDDLLTAVMRAFPNPDWYRHIIMDASLDGWSLFITQTETNDKKVHEAEHQLLATFSGRFTKNQCSWHITSKEAYPLHVAATKANWLLSNTKHPVSIHTDHRNLLLLFAPDSFHSKQYTVDRLLRWCLELQDIRYEIHHLPGELNILADFASRTPIKVARLAPILRSRADAYTRLFRMHRVQACTSLDYLSLDKLVLHQKRFAADIHKLSLDSMEYPLLKKGKLVVANEPEIVALIIMQAHIATGHRGIEPMLKKIKNKYCFLMKDSELREKAVEFKRECLHCRPDSLIIRRELKEHFHASKRFEIIHMDFLFVNQGKDYKYVLVIMDDYSNLVKLVPTESCLATDVVKALVSFQAQHSFASHVTFVSDKASYFVSKVLSEFCKLKGIKQKFSIAYHAFTNGSVERINRPILACLRSLLSQHRIAIKDWHHVLEVVELHLNHLSRRKFDNRSPVGVAHNIQEKDIDHGIYPVYLQDEYKIFDCSKASQEFDKLAEFFEEWHKKHVDSIKEFRNRANARQFTKYINFSVGDWVMISRPKAKQKSKVLFRWQGPAQVIELVGEHLVKVKFLSKDKIEEVHACRVAFYSSDIEGNEMEIAEQFFYDTDAWEIEKFKDIRFEDGVFSILTAWKGFTDLDDSWEPLLDLYEQVPSLVINYLTKIGNTEALALVE